MELDAKLQLNTKNEIIGFMLGHACKQKQNESSSFLLTHQIACHMHHYTPDSETSVSVAVELYCETFLRM